MGKDEIVPWIQDFAEVVKKASGVSGLVYWLEPASDTVVFQVSTAMDGFGVSMCYRVTGTLILAAIDREGLAREIGRTIARNWEGTAWIRELSRLAYIARN